MDKKTDPKINPLGQSVDDEKIRDKVRKKDLDLIKQVHEDLDREEKELKEFFSELKEPVKEDPTLTRKKRYEEKMNAYKQVIEGLDFKNLVSNFWSFEAATPEEIETLEDCRDFTRRNLFFYSAAGLAVTSGVNYYFRRDLPTSVKALGVFVGLVGGGTFGLIKSTEFTLRRRFERLGPDYDLGRLAIAEIDEFRTDKKMKKPV